MQIRAGNIPLFAPAIAWALDRREQRLIRRAEKRRADLGTAFIGITGSSGKSTTSALLTHILKGAGKVEGQHGANVFKALVRTLARLPANIGYVVVECGVGRPGQMAPMAGLLRPTVSIVTLVALEHKSAFGSIEAVAAEKAEMLVALAPDGVAILNGDDPFVSAMAARTTARIVTFGQGNGVAYRASAMRAAFPGRLTLTVNWRGGELNLRTRFVGEHFWLPVIAAVTAAIEVGVAPEIVAERVASFEPLPATCSVIELPEGANIILDTRKAPWHSIPLALDIVAKSAARRRRVILGHLSDFRGSNTKYGDFYKSARAVADEVVFIGAHRHRARQSPQDMVEGRFHAFATPREAADHLMATLVPGETVLLKGSSDQHLERLGLAFIEDVRCWIPACGKAQSCFACGRYRDPYEWHKGRKTRLSRHFLPLLRRLGIVRPLPVRTTLRPPPSVKSVSGKAEPGFPSDIA